MSALEVAYENGKINEAEFAEQMKDLGKQYIDLRDLKEQSLPSMNIHNWDERVAKIKFKIESMKNDSEEEKKMRHDDKLKLQKLENRLSQLGEEHNEPKWPRTEESFNIQITKIEKELHNLMMQYPSITRLIESLQEWENTQNFPSQYLIDITQDELIKIKGGPGRGTPLGSLHQIYVMKLLDCKDNKYYVGGTSKGYYQRCFEHSIGHPYRTHIKDKLMFGGKQYEKSIVSEIMDIVQPIKKKYPCWHVFEFWLQERMKEIGFSIPHGKNTKDIWNHTCHVCNEIAKKHNIPWDS